MEKWLESGYGGTEKGRGETSASERQSGGLRISEQDLKMDRRPWPPRKSQGRKYTHFFVRTKFIRTPSLRFGQMLRTFWMLKSPSFLIVLKVKY